ncbi:MAG: acyltransferase family protein, partial [Mycobacterium sp.]
YMVHELVHTAWDWAAVQFQVVLQDATGKWIIVGLLAAATGISMLLFHVVEEPARRWMRRMAGVKGATVRIEPPNDPINIELDAVDEIFDERRTAVPVSVL